MTDQLAPSAADDFAFDPDRVVLRPGSLIGGTLVEGDGETFEIIRPSDGKVLQSERGASPELVDRAVRAARRSHASGIWADAPARQRAQVFEQAVAYSGVLGAAGDDSIFRSGRIVRAASAAGGRSFSIGQAYIGDEQVDARSRLENLQPRRAVGAADHLIAEFVYNLVDQMPDRRRR